MHRWRTSQPIPGRVLTSDATRPATTNWGRPAASIMQTGSPTLGSTAASPTTTNSSGHPGGGLPGEPVVTGVFRARALPLTQPLLSRQVCVISQSPDADPPPMSLWLLALLPVDALPSRPPEDGADGVVMDALRYRQHLPNVVGGDRYPPTADLLTDDPGNVQPRNRRVFGRDPARRGPGQGRAGQRSMLHPVPVLTGEGLAIVAFFLSAPRPPFRGPIGGILLFSFLLSSPLL